MGKDFKPYYTRKGREQTVNLRLPKGALQGSNPGYGTKQVILQVRFLDLAPQYQPVAPTSRGEDETTDWLNRTNRI